MNSLESLSEWMFAASLRASVLAVAILGVQAISRRWLPAQWRYALWLPMLLVLVLPVLPTVPFGLFPSKMEEPRVMSPDPAILEKAGPAVVETPMPVQAESISMAGVLAITWLVGACVVFGVGFAGYRRSMRRIGKSSVVAGESLLRDIRNAASEAGVRRLPQVLVSPKVESPAVTGIFRPSLLLPAGFPKGFNEEETRLILLHEFTHLKRRDLAVNGLSCVLQALHWFNPILWFAFARMRVDREAACDAGVLSIGKVDRRAVYGGALLKLEGGFPSCGLSLGFVGIFERAAGLKSRIREISNHRPGGVSGKMTGLGLMALLVTFGATKAEEPAPKEAGEKAAEPMPAGHEYITKKLTTIVIPHVDAEDMSLEEMVGFLSSKVKQLDTVEKDPAKKGINFVIRKNRGGEAVQAGHITMQKRNIRLIDLLKETANQSGMTFKWDESGVTFLKAGSEMEGFVTSAPPPPAPQGKAGDFAMKLIIPRLEIDQMTLQAAVDQLNQQARELTKQGPVYPIVLDSSVDPNAVNLELRTRNAPLYINLQYLAGQLKYTLATDDKEIRISRP